MIYGKLFHYGVLSWEEFSFFYTTIMKKEIKNWIRASIANYNPSGLGYTYKLDRAIDDMWFNFIHENEEMIPDNLREHQVTSKGYLQAINDIEWEYKEYLIKKFSKAWKACYITRSHIF